MNINLAQAAKKKKNKSKSSSKKRATAANQSPAFSFGDFGSVGSVGDDDDNDDDRDLIRSGREAVNRGLVREQEAVRAQVQAAEAAAEAGIYDYDGAYDSFARDRDSSSKRDESQQQRKDGDDDKNKKSRYIGDLLQAAERRKRERDVVQERLLAREQKAEEEADPALRGKEKFVTAAYKRKLEERKLWEAKEEERQRAEEANDVTKKAEGMANFYGNFNRNVALGGGTDEPAQAKKMKKVDEEAKVKMEDDNDDPTMPGFLDGFQKGDDHENVKVGKPEPSSGTVVKREAAVSAKVPVKQIKTDTEEDPAERRKRMRLLREEKVEQARIRYFQRQAAKQQQQQQQQAQ